jgi:hypothetical protein
MKNSIVKQNHREKVANKEVRRKDSEGKQKMPKMS